jgi:hypothetical protein
MRSVSPDADESAAVRSMEPNLAWRRGVVRPLDVRKSRLVGEDARDAPLLSSRSRSSIF